MRLEENNQCVENRAYQEKIIITGRFLYAPFLSVYDIIVCAFRTRVTTRPRLTVPTYLTSSSITTRNVAVAASRTWLNYASPSRSTSMSSVSSHVMDQRSIGNDISSFLCAGSSAVIIMVIWIIFRPDLSCLSVVSYPMMYVCITLFSMYLNTDILPLTINVY